MFLEKLTKSKFDTIVELLEAEKDIINNANQLHIEINASNGSISCSVQKFSRVRKEEE